MFIKSPRLAYANPIQKSQHKYSKIQGIPWLLPLLWNTGPTVNFWTSTAKIQLEQPIKSPSCNRLLKCLYLRTAKEQKASRLIRNWGDTAAPLFQHQVCDAQRACRTRPKLWQPLQLPCLSWQLQPRLCSKRSSGPAPNPKVKSTVANLMPEVLEFKGFEENLRAFAQLRKLSRLDAKRKILRMGQS